MTDKFKLLKSRQVHSGRSLKFVVETWEFEGHEFELEMVKHPGAVVVVPQLENGDLILCRQYRPAVQQVLLEFPAGKLESTDVSLVEVAQREIQEEVGYAAKKIIDLGRIFPAPGFSDESQQLFYATELYPSVLEGDFDEDIETVIMSVSEVEQAIVSGDLKDAKSLAAYCKVKAAKLI